MAADFKSFMFAILIFGACFMVFITLIGDVSTKYSIPVEDSFNGSFNKINENFELSNQMSNKLYNTSVTDQNTFVAMGTGAFGAMRLLFNSFGIAKSMIEAFAQILGLPAWLVITAFTMVLITIIAILLKYIFRVPN